MQNTPATSSTAPRIRQAVRTANAKTAPPALPRAPLLHGLNRAVLWQLAACGTGLLLSAGQVYGGAAPFGLGLLLGCGNTYRPAAAARGVAVGGTLFSSFRRRRRTYRRTYAVGPGRSRYGGRSSPGPAVVRFGPADRSPVPGPYGSRFGFPPAGRRSGRVPGRLRSFYGSG